MIPLAFYTPLFVACLCFAPVHLYAVHRASREGEPQVAFYLLTRQNPTWEERQTIEIYNKTSFEESFFNSSRATKMYTFGWGGDVKYSIGTCNAYLSKQDINYIAIEWLSFYNSTFVGDAIVDAVQDAGLQTAAFIDWLVIDNGVPMETFHLISSSAGAHMLGAAGMAVTSGKIPRITGLDPANAETWYLNKTETRLDETDADFVDIMHTNGGVMADADVGFLEPIGHADFYVNGGQLQPGCEPIEYECCSHCRTVTYFDESIVTDVGFVSLRCDTYEEYLSGACNGNEQELMGEYTKTTARGVYHVKTNDVSPYAMGP